MFGDLNPQSWDVDWSVLLYDFSRTALIVFVAVLISYLAYRLVFGLVKRITHMSENQTDDLLVQRIRRPIKWSFIAIGVTLAAQFDASLGALWEPLAQFLRPALLGWIAYNIAKGLTAAWEMKLAESEDPLSVRSRKTRVAVLSRVITFAIVLITVGLMLFSIPSVRTIGTTMLASAGLAALAIGAAAQPPAQMSAPALRRLRTRAEVADA